MTASPQTQTERAAPALEPMLISIADGKKLIGNPCLDTIYKLIGSGQIEARKAGRRTLLVMPSLKRYAASLPTAEVKKHTPRRRNAK
jgi:hypothetical protein